MLELFFLLGFSLHNLEEAIRLPAWSKYASKFHHEVQKNEFHFAVLVVTIIGYLLTYLHIAIGQQNAIIQSVY